MREYLWRAVGVVAAKVIPVAVRAFFSGREVAESKRTADHPVLPSQHQED